MLDLLIIGGGINGLGIAADASARGLSVLLVEKGDFGGGTTAASTRLVHGGLRYLRHGELGLVWESLRERGRLLRARPHLVRPIDLLIPLYARQRVPTQWAGAGWQVSLGLRLYDLIARDPLLPRARRLTAAGAREREPDLDGAGLEGGFVYSDAQVEFPERLCVELMLEAAAGARSAGGGAEVLNHTEAVGLRMAGGRVEGAELRDTLTGRTWSVAAALTVNAAGPWVDLVNRRLAQPPPRLIAGTWGTHLVLPRRDGGPAGALYATARADGRPVFLLPWDDRLLLGTTDVPFEGDPDDLRVPEQDVAYLLAEANRLFPAARYSEADVEFTTIGVRPLPASPAGRRVEPGAITRRHFLIDHAREHGIGGLVSVVGGKLTTYQPLGQQVVRTALRRLGRHAAEAGSPVRAGQQDGTAGDQDAWLRAAAGAVREAGLPPEAAGRLLRLYGPRAAGVARLCGERPGWAKPLAPGSPALAGEVVWAVNEERARTVEDVLLRRLMRLPPTEAERAAVAQIAAESGVPLEPASGAASVPASG